MASWTSATGRLTHTLSSHTEPAVAAARRRLRRTPAVRRAPPPGAARGLLVGVGAPGEPTGQARLGRGVAQQADVPYLDDAELGRGVVPVERPEQRKEQHGKQYREGQGRPVPDESAQHGPRQAAERRETNPG